MIVKKDLIQVIIYQLNNLGPTGTNSDENSKPGDILDPDAGYGSANPERIFEDFIKLTLSTSGYSKNEIEEAWPDDWKQMTVNEIAEHIINDL